MAGTALVDVVNSPQDVLSDSNPFAYVRVEGPYTFPQSNTIELQTGTGISGAGKGGELYLLVKPGWELFMKMRAGGLQGAGQFNVFGREAVQQDEPRQAFNIQTAREYDGTFEGGRSLYFTARGGSLLVFSASGVRPLGDDWGASEGGSDAFLREVRNRGIIAPGRFTDGILLSLTAPFGNYDDPSTYSLRFNDPGASLQVSVITATNVQAETGETTVPSIRPEEGGVSYNPDQGGPDVQDATGYGPAIVMGEGTDVDGEGWSVTIRQNLETGEWVIAVDGAISESGLTEDEARQLAPSYVEARRQRAMVSDDPKDPNPPGFSFGEIPWLGILAGAFIVVALVVGVSSFAKGAGQAAVSGGRSDGEE